jgi:hypothetical protein|nr:MAG TPA: hypothetical protein [Caudoviricetes sp.]
MKREDCKPNKVVMLKGVIDHDDKTTVRPIKVNFIHLDEDEPHYAWFDPDQLFEVKEPTISRTRKFRPGDKVRFAPSGRMEYVKTPPADEEYVVTFNESDGWVNIKGGRYDNVIKWFDLELVEPADSVGERSLYEIREYEGSYFRVFRDGHYVFEVWYGSNLGSPYTRTEAYQKAREICDELNRKYNPSNN